MHTMQPERSGLAAGSSRNFAVACGLLSQYMKEKNRAAAMAAAAVTMTARKVAPVTMSLMPGADVDAGEDDQAAPEMQQELFPAAGDSGGDHLDRAPVIDRPQQSEMRSQLTIFYDGKVLVFDNFPADRAKELMHIASKSASNRTFTSVTAATPLVVAPTNAETDALSPQDMPLARKASLQLFLKKRRDRLSASARSPYNRPSITMPTATPKEEKLQEQPWLSLGSLQSQEGVNLCSN